MALVLRTLDTVPMLRCFWTVLICLTGCGSPAEPPVSNQTLRVISLSPAITGTLEDAGLAPYLVGRSTWCRTTTRDINQIPAVGDLHDRDWEALIRLQPTHVFIQSENMTSDQSLSSLAAEQNWSVHAWPLRTMDDIHHVLDEIPSVITFDDEEKNDELTDRCDQLRESLASSLQPSAAGIGKRVLIVNDGLPPLAWGRETYLGQMLEATGAENVLVQRGWTTLSMEDVVRLRPDLIIVATEKSSQGKPAIVVDELESVSQDKCAWLVHPRINFPGPHLAETSFAMQELLSAH